MSSTSMDEEGPIIPLLHDENYKETCDTEVNNIVPRLERLRISDNDEPIYLPSNVNVPYSSMNIVSSSINDFEEASMPDLNENVSPILESDTMNMISVDVDTKVAVESQICLSGAKETSQILSRNIQIDIQSQEFIPKTSADGEIHTHPIDSKEEKILNLHNESKEIGVNGNFDGSPLDLSLTSNFDLSNAVNGSSAVSGKESELPSSMVVPEKKYQIHSKTRKIAEFPTNFPVTLGSYSKEKAMDQFSDEIANGTVSDPDSLKPSYSADVSSDDIPDIGDVNPASVKNKHSRKIAIVSSVSAMKKIGHRHFGVSQPLSNIINALKTNSTSDEDNNKYSSSSRKDSPVSARRKCKKIVKSSQRPNNLKHSEVKKEETLPSTYKRKNSEHMTDTTRKFRKRSSSEQNSAFVEKTRLAVRSRSLSSGLMDIKRASISNPSTKNSILQSRKRANSDCKTESSVKFRRSSS